MTLLFWLCYSILITLCLVSGNMETYQLIILINQLQIFSLSNE